MPHFKRRVFHIAGFDPRGVAYYHDLFCREMARHAERSGEAIELSPVLNRSATRADWTITNRTADVVTHVTFLRWEDIVRANWARRGRDLVGRAVHAYLAFLTRTDLPAIRRLGRGALIAFSYPPLACLLAPVVIGLAVAAALLAILPGWLAMLAGSVAALLLGPRAARLVHAPWLLRFFVFNDELAKGLLTTVVDPRLDAFADQVAEGVEGADEILLVTHSNGSILGVSVMARLLGRWNGEAPRTFAFVTLGQCIPLLACRRDARWFADELRMLASTTFRWVDIGSPADGAAFHGVNPMLLCAPSARPRVTLLSPRFHLFRDSKTSRRGWWHKYAVHFDYLRGGDRISPVDHPSLMTAPRRIDESIRLFEAIP